MSWNLDLSFLITHSIPQPVPIPETKQSKIKWNTRAVEYLNNLTFIQNWGSLFVRAKYLFQDFLILWELESPPLPEPPQTKQMGILARFRSPGLGQLDSSTCQAELLVIKKLILLLFSLLNLSEEQKGYLFMHRNQSVHVSENLLLKSEAYQQRWVIQAG